jgi:ribonuclease D
MRPIERKIKNTIIKQFETIWNLVEYLPEYLERNPEYLREAFNNYNSPDYLLSIYQHHEFKEIDASQENITVQEQNILNSVFVWREHTAKLMDISSEGLLPSYYVFQIVEKKAKTVNQISEIVADHKLGMDHFPKILEAIKIGEETCLKSFELPKKSRNSFSKEDSNVRNLLTEIGWNDKDWLNRKNDESIKMYKEIISIDEFDDSLAADQIEHVSEKVLKKYEIARYIKYAQFLRNGN